MLMPRIGVAEPAMSRAARSMVPSPPKTRSKSDSRASVAVSPSTTALRPARRMSCAALRRISAQAAFSEFPISPMRLILSAYFFNQHQKFLVARRAEQRRFRHTAPVQTVLRGGKFAAVLRKSARARQRRVMTPRPLSASALPASNCGLTSATILPFDFSKAMAGGKIFRSEIKEQSITARSAGENGCGNCSGFKCRALVFSMTTTRLSFRSFHANWPCPTSTAKTFAAPFCRRQSVKPPVEAPRSIATVPATSS